MRPPISVVALKSNPLSIPCEPRERGHLVSGRNEIVFCCAHPRGKSEREETEIPLPGVPATLTSLLAEVEWDSQAAKKPSPHPSSGKGNNTRCAAESSSRRVFQQKSAPTEECSSRRVFQPKSVPAEESVKNGDVRSSAKGEKSVRESFEKRRESPRESEPSEEM